MFTPKCLISLMHSLYVRYKNYARKEYHMEILKLH